MQHSWWHIPGGGADRTPGYRGGRARFGIDVHFIAHREPPPAEAPEA